jgi:putative membrane protein
MDALLASLTGLTGFLMYFAASLAMLAVFIMVYMRVTPYHEIELIREGNTAAAVSLAGAVLGFALPLASSIIGAATLADMLMWAVIALLGQLIGYAVVRLAIPHLATDIPQGKLAAGVFLGAVSLAVGILNAACMAL